MSTKKVQTESRTAAESARGPDEGVASSESGATPSPISWEPAGHNDEPRDQHAFLGGGFTAGIGPESDGTWSWTITALEHVKGSHVGGDDVAWGRADTETEAKAAVAEWRAATNAEASAHG